MAQVLELRTLNKELFYHVETWASSFTLPGILVIDSGQYLCTNNLREVAMVFDSACLQGSKAL